MEEAKQNGNGAPQPATHPFVAAVAQALDVKQISPVCRECGLATEWSDWMLLPRPVAIPIWADPGEPVQASMAASLACRLCGHVRLYRLDLLGVKMEQRRIITPP